MDFEPGTQFADRYRIVKVIGRGGAGTVLKAEDTRFGRIVAIKVFNQAVINEPELVRQVFREADVLNRLSHPSIIRLYDYGVYQDVPYLVMEYAERSLADVLREGKQRPEYAFAIVAQVADALAYAHSKGIVHRDVKPSNILISGDDRILLSDFGLALPHGVSSLADTGRVLGTPTYVSPEQAKGLPLDARSDIYSLAVVVFELLVGQPPFLGSSPAEIIAQHVEKPAPLELLRPLSNPRLERALDKALAKEPSNRFATVEEFVRELREALNWGMLYDVQPAAAPPPPFPRVLHSRRMPHAVALGLGLLLILAAVVVVVQVYSPLRVFPTEENIWRGPIIIVLLVLVTAGLGVSWILKKRSKRHPTLTFPMHEEELKASSSDDEDATQVVSWPLPDASILQHHRSPLAWLVPINGPNAGQTFRLSDDKFTIGRGPECSLPLDDSAVSRNHAIVIFEDDRYWLYDLASSNGTFVNGERVMKHELRDRDEIVIGQTNFIFKEVATPGDLTTDAQRRLWEFEALWSEVAQAVRHE